MAHDHAEKPVRHPSRKTIERNSRKGGLEQRIRPAGPTL